MRIFDLAFYEALHRPFNPVNDWRLLPAAIDMLGESFGTGWADAVVVGAGVLVIALPIGIAFAVARVSRVAVRRRRLSGCRAGCRAESFTSRLNRSGVDCTAVDNRPSSISRS